MDISVISWVRNSQETIKELYTRVSSTMSELSVSYEIILVDDHSTDNSWEIIKTLHKEDPHVKAIHFRRYHGQSAGLQAGFDQAKGDLIFTLSSTLENNPEDLIHLAKKLKTEDLDMIVGVRKHKLKGKKSKQVISTLANKLISLVSGHNFTDVTSPFRLVKRDVLKHFRVYGDHYMFLPVLATLSGAKFGEAEISHGKPKSASYKHMPVMWHRMLLDLLVLKFLVSAYNPPFSTAPIRIFGGAGFVSAFFGFISGCILVIDKLVYGQDIGGRPLLLLSVLLVMLGAVFIVMGLLGELMLRIYFEGQNKMTYTVKELLG